MADNASDEPEREPEAQVLPERKLMRLVSADPPPGDPPVPEADPDDPGPDGPDGR